MKYSKESRFVALALTAAVPACLGIAEVEPDGSGGATGNGGSSIDASGEFPTGSGGAGGAPPDASSGGGTGGSSGGGTGGAGGTSAGGTGGSGGGGGTGGIPGGSLTLKPGLALAGDGFLAQPSLCGNQVHDSYQQASYKAIHVGRDVPCGGKSTYRAFVRFDLSPVPGPVKKATLKLYYAQKQDPTAGVSLLGIDDFQQLVSSSWNASVWEDFGTVITPSSSPGWITTGVSSHVKAAQAAGAAAFELRYQNEAEDPGEKSRWYGVVATENGSNGPELVVEY